MNKYIDTFNKLQTINMPKYLYKYRKVNKYTIDMLENEYLWCDSVDTYNDPYEGFFNSGFIVPFKAYLIEEIKDNIDKKQIEYFMNIKTKEELLKYVNEELHFIDCNKFEIIKSKYEKFIKNKNDDIKNKLRSKYKICSLTEHFDNILMWSHYANFHKGICIKYDTNELKDYLYNVNYAKNILDLTNMIRLDSPDINIFEKLMMITKSKIWQYEDEWRIVIDQKLIKNNKYKATPVGIYLGTNISKQSRGRVINKAREKNLEIYELAMDYTKYKLISEKLN